MRCRRRRRRRSERRLSARTSRLRRSKGKNKRRRRSGRKSRKRSKRRRRKLRSLKKLRTIIRSFIRKDRIRNCIKPLNLRMIGSQLRRNQRLKKMTARSQVKHLRFKRIKNKLKLS